MQGSSTQPGQTYVGALAVLKIYKHCIKIHQDEILTTERAWPLQVFRYLLPEDLREQSLTLFKEIWKSNIKHVKPQTKSSKASGVTSDSAVSQAMALFWAS